MNRKHIMILIAIVALAIVPIGSAWAMYMADGAVQNGTTGGWTAPSDGICVLDLHSDGTMDVDTTITTKRDCDARLVPVPGANTTTGCTTASSTGYLYKAPGSSTCVTIDGSGNVTGSISLVGNDRNEQICNALGTAQGKTAHMANNAAVTSLNGNCLAYSFLFRGQDASGNPLAFGTKGTAQASNTGFCYTTMNTGIAAASCPTVVGSSYGTKTASSTAAFGYNSSASACTYSYGISGPVTSALKSPVTGATLTAAGASIDLSQFTTYGACLANGGTWSNWIPIGATATTGAIGTISNAVTFDLTRQAVSADNGCLHCHSNSVQYNQDLYRYKDSYLLTGHKNMLRKVTPGMAWGGPNASGVLTVYTTDGTNSMTWGTLGVPGSALDGTNPMYYVYGDWMIAAPTVAIAGSNYSCANCHSTGFGNGTTAQSPAIPGVQSIGTPGYAGTQPADAGAGYVSAVKTGWKWDLEGINCSRCHNATVPGVVQAQITASSYPTTAITGSNVNGGGMGQLAAATGRNNLCFGCHQSIAKSWPSGAAQYDPTVIPTGVSHGAAAGRDFNGHVLGNSFLNSVHARYAGAQSGNGSITLNSLGENDLTDPNGTTEYNSIFKGYTCYQGAPSGGDVAVHDASGNAFTPTSCNTLYGSSSWAVDTNGTQGTCTTCHDVHNSLFVASQSSKAIVKECVDCHVNNATTGATDVNAPQITNIYHPQSSGTPFDTALYGSDSCAVCHMATQAEKNGNQNSMPVHVWRINTDANYSTFPTIGQFYGGTCTVHTGAVQNAPSFPVVYLSDTSSANCTAAAGTWAAQTENRNANTAPETYSNGTKTYPNAVWVDIDMACGQCHGGSLGSSATANGAPYIPKSALAGYAAGMHTGQSVYADFTWTQDATVSKQVDFDASRSTCASGNCTYSWSGAFTATGINVTNATWTGTAPYSVTLTVKDVTANSTATKTDTGVTPKTLYTSLTPALTTSVSGFIVTVTDATTNNNGAITGDVMWGDGSADGSITALGGNTSHTYAKAGTYIIKYIVTDSAVNSAGINIAKNTSVRVVVGTSQGYSVSGTIENNASAAILNANATLSLLDSTGKVLRRTTANADGTFTFLPVAPGTYTIEAIGNALVGTTPTRFTFANVSVTVQNNGSGSSGIAVKAN